MGYICKNPWTTLFVWGNGEVTHCCYSNIGSLGNIKNKSLMDIWTGQKLRYVREQMTRGEYLKAGCEYFCRSYRWNQYYGSQNTIREIPEGLGRVEELDASWAVAGPRVLGFGIDWKCNLSCRHCLASRKGKGVSMSDFMALRANIQQSRFLRFMGGEFSINNDTLEILRQISALTPQPTVFLATNGQTSLNTISEYIRGLQGFHLKFSLEGLGQQYENIRVGGSWSNFEKNLDEAVVLFNTKQQAGLDWRIYLNFCVMKSNFSQLPLVLSYAIKKNIRLVLNTINGMRHVDENMFMYASACPSADDVETVGKHCLGILATAHSYGFTKQISEHLDYILKCASAKKLKAPTWLLKAWLCVCRGRFADWTLYTVYRLTLDPGAFILYAWRKVRSKIMQRLQVSAR